MLWTKHGRSGYGKPAMGPAELTIVLILVITSAVSIYAFYNPALQDRLIFWPERILAAQEYYRLFSSALLHADWLHLLLNMYVFWAFGLPIASYYGPASLAFIYLGSILGGSLLSLFIHRHHDYRALGASGGVYGVLISYLFLFPGSGINHFFILPIPGWLFVILFVVGSYYGIRSQRGNIGHDAHLGGGIVGLLIATALYPSIIRHSPYLYAAVLLLSLLIFGALLLNPLHLPWKSYQPPPVRPTKTKRETPEPNDQERLDAILDKISKSGVHSLSRADQEFLRRASRKK